MSETIGSLFVPIDLNTVSDDFVLLPEGIYKMQVEKMEPKQSNAGNPMVNVTMNVLEPVDHMGRKGFTNLVLVASAMWKVKQFVKAIGLSYDQGGFNLGDALGREVTVKVTQESYTDKEGNNKIRNVFDEFLGG